MCDTKDSSVETVKTCSITYKDIANKLISDKLLLTALELHTELLECGKEIPLLKDFFSNPGNFELTQEITSRLSRSGSQATLDSLDLTRYSEDGAGTDERIAVLEFELRKAKETINALRNNLTVATESETSTPDKGSFKCTNQGLIKPHEQRALNFLINEYLLLHDYKLTSITFGDENQSQDFDDWDDVGLNIAKPAELLRLYRDGLKFISDSTSISTQTGSDEDFERLQNEIQELRTKLEQISSENDDLKIANSNLRKENEILVNSSKENESSAEKFEMIDNSMTNFKKQDSISIIEDNVSNNSFNASDWTNLSVAERPIASKPSHFMQDLYKNEVFNESYIRISEETDCKVLNRILKNPIGNDDLIHVLSETLPRLIPNIILVKRETAIPLLISAVLLNPNGEERDQLLQQLFNLKKKPTEDERKMILTGIIGVAKFANESLVENEILPQCWEQMSHKYVERRLLVAEFCTVLIPYVSSQIRNSLVLSILQQMMDDREAIVRQTVVKALSLVMVLCEDHDKYAQCQEIVLATLNDANEEIVDLSVKILFPVLAKWSLENDNLLNSLLKLLLQILNQSVRDIQATNKNGYKIVKTVAALERILPFLLMTVVESCGLTVIENEVKIDLRDDLKHLCSNLTNPLYFSASSINVGRLLFEFENRLASNPEVTSPQINWLLDIMIPDLINNLNHIDLSHQAVSKSFMRLFSTICIVFGENFTGRKIRPILETHITSLEQIIANFNQYASSLNIIPIYLVSLLGYCDRNELVNSFKKFVCTLPICGTHLECLELSARGLCERQLQGAVIEALWEGVAHQRQLVRAATANLFAIIVAKCDREALVARVAPALVTLASDGDVLVKTATIPALGSLIQNCGIGEIHDKAYLQLETFIADAGVKENHSFLRQLVVTLGQIANSCTQRFRNDVILPELCAISGNLPQMMNQTRRVDLTQALIEAFTNFVYNNAVQNENSLKLKILISLRCLEVVVQENSSLLTHREALFSMMRECDNKNELVTSPSSIGDRSLSQNVNQGVEEMRQRVSKIFNKPNKPNSIPNLQGIFKKK